MPEKSYKKKHLTSFQLIILGFAGVILLGSVLLMLPFVFLWQHCKKNWTLKKWSL